jgi:Holliday junction resolvase RusA-like endonuclease
VSQYAAPDLFAGQRAPEPPGLYRERLGRPVLSFTVHGTPAPAGSKKAVPMGRGPGARWGVIDANPKAKGWKTLVAQAAGEAMAGRALFQGPLELTLRFYVRRPKGHHGKNGLLASAPAYPVVKPDALKLARGVEDALSGVVYRDDAQIVNEVLAKRYGPERVEIEVREL